MSTGIGERTCPWGPEGVKLNFFFLLLFPLLPAPWQGPTAGLAGRFFARDWEADAVILTLATGEAVISATAAPEEEEEEVISSALKDT